MTYLEAVNSVLRRLREDQADTILETSYSALIGDFINDAKKVVEESWNWSSLRSEIIISTVANSTDYTLTNLKMNGVIKYALNDTANCFISYQTKAYFDQWYYNNTPASGTPSNYTFIGTDAMIILKLDCIQSLTQFKRFVLR